MKFRFSILLLTMFSACSPTAKDKQHNDLPHDKNNQVVEYEKVRDTYRMQVHSFLNVHREEPKRIDSIDNKTHDDLTQRLRAILKGSLYSGQGEPSLPIFVSGIGWDLLDGLTIKEDSFKMFYTHEKLCLDIFTNEKFERFDQFKPDDFARLFSRAFIDDANASSIATFKIPTAEKDIEAFGMVAVITQGYYSSPPEALYVLVSKESYVYMAEAKSWLKEMINCSKNQRDSTGVVIRNMDDKDWVDYRNCCQRELQNSGDYQRIKKQAQKIVRQIMHGV